MKIAQLNSWLFWRGAEQQVLYLAQFLQGQQGCDSVVVCPPRGVLHQRACEAGVSVMALDMRNELDLAAAWRLGSWLRRQCLDILHMHAPHAHSIGLLACFMVPRVRKIVSRRIDKAAPSQSVEPLQIHAARYTVRSGFGSRAASHA